MSIQEKLKELEPKSMHSMLPVEWKCAKNDIVTDMKGKKYIDFTSTIFVMNVGHANKKVRVAIKKALDKQLLHSYTYPHKLRLQFLKKLIEITPPFCEKAFLLSSGTEATETAVRLMRMKTGRKKIISFKGAMHGRTMCADLMKGTGFYEHEDFLNLPFPTENSNFFGEMKKLNVEPSLVAGFMIETYQGWSAKFLPKNYVQDLCAYAHAIGACVTFDDIQAGFWRTGKLFGYQHYQVTPDLVCIGKAIGGGLPLSSVLGRKEIMDIPEVGDMSSTHSANPLCCASGLAVLNELEKLDKRELKNKEFIFIFNITEIFHTYREHITEINVKGLVAGIVFKDKELASKVCHSCMESGLLVVHTGIESIKLAPPLTITEYHLKKGLEILKREINDNTN